MDAALTGSSLAKQLASCDKKTRDIALRTLKTWLPLQHQVSEDEMKKIWKGLFYCVWHADKQLVQLELINRLASLPVSLDLVVSLHYIEVFLTTMGREWSGIDFLRLDKFYLLLRRFLHNLFFLLKKNSWDIKLLNHLMCILEEKSLLVNHNYSAQGINYHICEIFLDELKPFLPIRRKAIDSLLSPFFSVMMKSSDKVQLNKIKSSMFGCLLRNGRKLLELRKTGNDVHVEVEDEDVVLLFGTIAFNLGLPAKFFDMGSSSDCLQGNRKVLFALYEEFLKLMKDLENAGIEIPYPEVEDDNADEVPDLILITGQEVQAAEVLSSDPVEVASIVANLSDDKSSQKKKKKNKKAEVSSVVANHSDDKSSKKNKKTEVASVVANDSADKSSKKKKKKKAEVDSVVANCSDDKSSKKAKKAKKASGGSGKKAMLLENGTTSDDQNEVVNVSNGENSNDDGGVKDMDESNDEHLIAFNESVMSNLKMQFEKVAAEVGMGVDGVSSLDSPTASVNHSVSRKRKRSKSKDAQVSHTLDLSSLGVIGGTTAGKSEDKSAKKVRFSMKNNLVWKPQSPLPPQSLRLPPSVTPRGSALKKGIPPGPVKEIPSTTKRVKLMTSSVKKGRKVKKSVSPAIKRLRKLQSLSV